MGSDSPSGSSDSTGKTCATCRFAATYRRKQIVDGTGFGDQMMFKDPDRVTAKDADGNEYTREVENEVVYSCHAFADSYSITMIGDDGKTVEVSTGPQPMPVDQNGQRVKMPLCEYAGKDIGIVPITCDAWQPIRQIPSEKLSELDRMIAAREERVKEREARERKGER